PSSNLFDREYREFHQLIVWPAETQSYRRFPRASHVRDVCGFGLLLRLLCLLHGWEPVQEIPMPSASGGSRTKRQAKKSGRQHTGPANVRRRRSRALRAMSVRPPSKHTRGGRKLRARIEPSATKSERIKDNVGGRGRNPGLVCL